MTKPQTLDDLFATDRQEREAAYLLSQTPGTPEHAREQAQTAAHQRRVADTVARVVAAGGVLGVTHTDQGEPIDLTPALTDEEIEAEEEAEEESDDQ